jgi:hypothetical protein
MPTYHKLLSGSHTRWEGSKKSGAFYRYEAGTDHDTMVGLTEDEIANFNRPNFPARVRPTGPPKSGAAAPKLTAGDRTPPTAAAATTPEPEDPGHFEGLKDATPPDTSETGWFTDLTVAEAADALADVKTVAEAKKLRAAEVAGHERVTLLKAIDNRIAELESA